MRLSAPIFRLKRQAKVLSRKAGVSLNKALDQIARDEGFKSWSLLAARYAADRPATAVLEGLVPGDLLLLGARPGHGKTLMALELLVEVVKMGGRGVFYTLEYTESDVLERLRSIGADPATFSDAFAFDTSDAISADYIIESVSTAPPGTVVVIDYLQLLDQKRQNPDIAVQVRALKAFAEKAGLIVVFISQIDRSYDPSAKDMPDMADIRLPNPLDLTLFTKTCFLNDGKVTFEAAA